MDFLLLYYTGRHARAARAAAGILRPGPRGDTRAIQGSLARHLRPTPPHANRQVTHAEAGGGQEGRRVVVGLRRPPAAVPTHKTSGPRSLRA
eukprot:scaffold8363_cov32-Tisochrysis_lutea.AAC.4